MSASLVTVGDDGLRRGADPRELTTADLEQAGILPRPVLAAIRAKCLDCCCEQRSEVACCTLTHCALWPFRMGTNPFRTAREMTDEQRQAAGERLSKARAARAVQ
jgi:hypothetical protein